MICGADHLPYVNIRRLQLRVFVQRVERLVAAETRLLIAAEGHFDAPAVARVHGHGSRAQGTREFMRARQIVGP